MEKQPPSSNKWPFTAGLIILGALFLTRGGLASVAPLLRYVLPVVIGYLGFRYVKVQVTARLMAAMQEKMRPGQRQAAQEAAGPVIDLCPKCGTYLKPGHRCSK